MYRIVSIRTVYEKKHLEAGSISMLKFNISDHRFTHAGVIAMLEGYKSMHCRIEIYNVQFRCTIRNFIVVLGLTIRQCANYVWKHFLFMLFWREIGTTTFKITRKVLAQWTNCKTDIFIVDHSTYDVRNIQDHILNCVMIIWMDIFYHLARSIYHWAHIY